MTSQWSLEEKSALAGVFRLLSIRDRSAKEIAQYFQKKQALSQEQIDNLTSYLNEHRLINDQDFAKKWAAARARQGKGERIIAQELKIKGVDSSHITVALDQITEDNWFEGIDKVCKKAKLTVSRQLTYQEKAKVYQALFRRGYPSRLIDAYLTSKVE
jgi:regulatory protein